jgi:hypothetical protein
MHYLPIRACGDHERAIPGKIMYGAAKKTWALPFLVTQGAATPAPADRKAS